jgi:hypothetical protein
MGGVLNIENVRKLSPEQIQYVMSYMDDDYHNSAFGFRDNLVLSLFYFDDMSRKDICNFTVMQYDQISEQSQYWWDVYCSKSDHRIRLYDRYKTSTEDTYMPICIKMGSGERITKTNVYRILKRAIMYGNFFEPFNRRTRYRARSCPHKLDTRPSRIVLDKRLPNFAYTDVSKSQLSVRGVLDACRENGVGTLYMGTTGLRLVVKDRIDEKMNGVFVFRKNVRKWVDFTKEPMLIFSTLRKLV